MKIIRLLSRLLLGLVFIFSGFVKAVDPMGSTFKFTDYFFAFGLEALNDIALPLAIVLSTLEFVVGMALVFNARIRLTAWIALAFMLFFTPLTLVLAITNPVTDCGCFGDALVLSNWETFGKNTVLLALAFIVFAGRKKGNEPYSVIEQYLLLTFSTCFAVGLSLYSYRHLPIIDFRPYHVGANISDGMKIPEGAPADEYRSLFTYEKNGEVKEFDESNYPWQDSTWTFVDAVQIKVKEGYTPPIHDFSISNEYEGDITDRILSEEDYVFILVSKNVAELKEESLFKIRNLAAYAMQNKIQFIGLTASGKEETEQFRQTKSLLFEFYNTDEIQLKTMIRSNPGLLLLRKGTILDKWHYNDIPKAEDLKGDLAAHVLTKHQKINIKLISTSITSTLLLLISLFVLVRRRGSRVKNSL